MAVRGMDRLSVLQSDQLVSWLPDVFVMADLSWGVVDSTVLHVRCGERELVVKAGGLDDHHIARELRAHREFTTPWVRRGLAARLVHAADRLSLLVTEYLPGDLALGTRAATDPDVHRRAGVALRLLHDQAGEEDSSYDADEVAYSLHLLDTPHRMDRSPTRALRAWLTAYVPGR